MPAPAPPAQRLKPRPHVRPLLLVALGVATFAGCVSRRPLVEANPTTLPADQRIEVWRRGRVQVLHHASVDSNAVGGLVGAWRPGCDSCRVAIPRAEIDSLVLVNREGAWFAGGALFLGWIWVKVWHCWPFLRCSD